MNQGSVCVQSELVRERNMESERSVTSRSDECREPCDIRFSVALISHPSLPLG